jgi:alpha-glucoside transport system substrate-binding protein
MRPTKPDSPEHRNRPNSIIQEEEMSLANKRWWTFMVVTVMVALACSSAPTTTQSPRPPAATPTAVAATPTAVPATQPPATQPPATEPPATEPPPTEPPATEPPATEPPPTPEPTEAPAVLPQVPTGYAELDQALAPAPEGGTQMFAGTRVTIQVQYNGAEGDLINATVADFEAATGINIVFDEIGSNHELVLKTLVDGGNPPDIAQIAQPAAMANYARDGKLVALDDFMDVNKLHTDYADAFMNLATVDGKVYGVFFKADTGSVVWYPIQAFADNGYEIPATWDELLALSDEIIADGNGNPWCISVEHGGATGWVGTNWVEDVLMRTAPPQVYQDLVAHNIPFTAPEVRHAFDLVAQIFFTPDYAYGGNTYINSTWVGQTMDPMFNDDLHHPQCWMQHQATWYDSFFPDVRAETPKYSTGTDVGLFYFPPIDPQYGNPAQGAGDQFMMFTDRPEVRAVMEFLATPEAAYGWIKEGGITSANRSVPSSWYDGSYKSQVAAGIFANASTLLFDASDSMPPEVGGAFNQGMFDWIAANGANTDEILQTIEDSWQLAQ